MPFVQYSVQNRSDLKLVMDSYLLKCKNWLYYRYIIMPQYLIILIGYQQLNQNKNKVQRCQMGCFHSKKSGMKMPRRKQYSQNIKTVQQQPYVGVEKKQNHKLSAQERKLQQNLKIISDNPNMWLLIDKKVFPQLAQRVSKQNWSDLQKNALSKLLEDHIRYSTKMVSKKSVHIRVPFQYNLSDYGKIFGNDVREIQRNFLTRNHWNLRSLEYGQQFMKYHFSFDEKYQKQHQQIEMQVKMLSEDDPLAVFYIVTYLKRCCKQMEKNKVPMKDINKRLQQFVKKMNQNFSSNSEFGIDMLYVFMFQQKEFGKLKKQEFPYKKVKFVLKQKDKKQQLNKRIVQLVDIARSYEQKFLDITYSNCIKNQGFGYSLNVKVQGAQDEDAMRRIKQKLFKQQIQKIYKKKQFESKTIKKLRKQEFKFKKEVMKKIYQQTNQLQFDVTDLLRGRCYFKRVSYLNKAACDIIVTVQQLASQGQDIQVVQLDNRIKTQTNDIVLKIRFGKIVTEFQLALRFKETQSQIYHQMYEISRSQMLSPVVLLYEGERQSTNQFFSEVQQVIKQINQPRQIKSQLKRKCQQLQKFIIFKEDEQSDSEQMQQLQSQFKNPHKQIFKQQNLSQDKKEFLSRQTLIRTGDYYIANGNVEQGLKYYQYQLELQQKSSKYSKMKALNKINQIYKSKGYQVKDEPTHIKL